MHKAQPNPRWLTLASTALAVTLWTGLAPAQDAPASDAGKTEKTEKSDAKKSTDATGTWKWTMRGGRGGGGGGGNAGGNAGTGGGAGGGQGREVSLKLKQDGDKLTGALTGFGGNETEIKDGSVKDGQISFKITREVQGQERTQTYTGKVDGDTITGKIEGPGRGGQTTTRDWTATRAKPGDEKKKDGEKKEGAAEKKEGESN